MTVAITDQATFVSDAIGDCFVLSMAGVEGMSMLPEWSLRIISRDANLALDQAIGTMGQLSFADDDGALRSMSLLITSAAYAGSTRDGHLYDLELAANLWLLTRRFGYRIFQEQGVKSIVTQLLIDAGVQPDLTQWRLVGDLSTREQCVQYSETEWNFVERLLADEGINYWFETNDDGNSVVIFGDSPSAHEPIAGGGLLPFEDGSGLTQSASSFFALERGRRVTQEATHVVDYDVFNPAVLIEGRAGGGALEHYEYPAWVPDADAAQRRADVRLEQLKRLHDYANGKSHSARLQPGRVVTVAGVADDYINGHYLVTRVRHALEQSTPGNEQARHYSNDCLLVPQDGERAFRPELPRHLPRIEGIETAIVTGAGGEEIHVDQLGRIKLSFPWDRSGITDDTSSRWIRSMQLNMGNSMMLPRVGWEVPVLYRDGCPDEPRCLAKLYNATARVPYPLPDKKATASLQSGTSPADGTTNEIRLDDVASSEEMMVHASGSQKVDVGGTNKTTVTAKETYNVGGNFVEHIEGLQEITVSATQTIDVAGPTTSKIKGSRTVISGTEKIGIDKNRALDCGGDYSEAIGGLYFIRTNQSTDACNGSFVQAVGGIMGVTAGCGLNEVVAGARIELTGGARNVVTGPFEDKAAGAKRITAGATNMSAGGAIVTKCKSGATIAAAATTLHSGSTLVISGDNVTLDAASVIVKGGSTLSLGGSHAASSDVTHKGSVSKHKGSTKARG